ARDAAAGGELRRLCLRQPDAGAGTGLRHAHRRDLVSDEVFRGSQPDQLPPFRALRLRRALDQRVVPPVALEPGQAEIPVEAAALAAALRSGDLARMMPPTARRERIAWYLLLALALLAGIFLRVWQLDRQILLDDEWHAINKLLRAADARDIAT